MSEKSEKSSSIQDGVSSVSTADIAQHLRGRIGLLAGERQWSDTRDAWLQRAARACGLRFSRVRAIWYGERSRFWWDEVQAIEEAAAKRLQELQEIEARNAAIRMAIARHDRPRANERDPGAMGALAHEASRAPERAVLDQGHDAVRRGRDGQAGEP